MDYVLQTDAFLLAAIKDAVEPVRSEVDEEVRYLSQAAPNAIEWITQREYLGYPSLFKYTRQYEVIRDVFNLRCRICNSVKPEDVDCWGKSRAYLESEVLLTWSAEHMDFVCPKCRNTLYDFYEDKIVPNYNEAILIVGMRSGKSFACAMIASYIEHIIRVWSTSGRRRVQKMLGVAADEILEMSFAASTATQAELTAAIKYREMRNNSPWIEKHVGWIKAQEKKQLSVAKDPWRYVASQRVIEDGWCGLRINVLASDSAGVAGKTRCFCSIDEFGRLINTESSRSAKELYAVMNQSLTTVRTAARKAKLPSFLGLFYNITSPIAIDDPAFQIYNKAAAGELERTHFWKGATWQFNPFITREDLEEEFKKDPVAAERDFGANPPMAATPYVHNPWLFWQCVDWRKEPLAEFETVHLGDPTGRKYVGLRVTDAQLNRVATPHFVFCDAGLSFDAFSLVIAHGEWVNASEVIGDSDVVEETQSPPPPGMQHISQLPGMRKLGEPPSGPQEMKDQVLVTTIDAVARIVPTVDREVWFGAILDILVMLKEKIKIFQLASDSWNSASTHQQVRNLGIVANNITLKPEDFMSFLNSCYNGRVKMLPPLDDEVSMTPEGKLVLSVQQEHMAAQSVVLVEVLKLSRSSNLRTFTNENKGVIRGRDSDDLARCVIGCHRIVQEAVIDQQAARRGLRNLPGRINQGSFSGRLIKGGVV